jgi:hypothetical protein
LLMGCCAPTAWSPRLAGAADAARAHRLDAARRGLAASTS